MEHRGNFLGRRSLFNVGRIRSGRQLPHPDEFSTTAVFGAKLGQKKVASNAINRL